MASSKPQNSNNPSVDGSAAASVLKRQNSNRAEKSLRGGLQPISIDWGEGGTKTKVAFSDGLIAEGSCVRCVNPPCIEFQAEELIVPKFEQFPADGDRHVCPTEAIQWDTNSPAPVVNAETCISCGLCVSRCPAGAIYLDGKGAHVNDAQNDAFVETGQIVETENNKALQKQLSALPRTGQFLSADYDEFLEFITARIVTISSVFPAQFPNRVARNLLLGVGISCAMRRLGDVNLRMDLIMGAPGVEQGTAEVELGAEVLNTPRNLLDSVAVLCHRYNFDKADIVPLVVTARLPNKRTEYWRVIGDISKVLDVPIRSLTFAALIVLIWNQKRLNLSDKTLFHADDGTNAIRNFVEDILGREVTVSDNSSGLFEATK